MGWSRYDDELIYNRKVTALRSHGVNGLAALGLQLMCNTWARHEGTGGHVPLYMPEQLGGRPGPKLALLLETVGMFDPVPGGWFIHNFDDFSDPNDDGRSAAERKRDLSEKRAKAGSKGGSKTASKRPPLLAANDQQCSSPVPVPEPVLERVTDNSTLENTPEGVDNSRRRQTINVYGQLELAAAKTRGTHVTSDQAYAGQARRTCANNPDLDRLLEQFPTAPASAVAAWLTGDKHSQGYYPRTDELAHVHQLDRGAAS